MTAQPHNRFVFCVVVVEFAVNGNQALVSTVVSFVYKDKWWFDESMSVIFCMENI